MLAILNAESLAFVHANLFAFGVPSNTPALPLFPNEILYHFLLLSKAVKPALFHDVVISICIRISQHIK